MDETQAWNARREELEADLIAAAKRLLKHMRGAAAFMLPMEGGKVVAAGDRKEARKLLE